MGVRQVRLNVDFTPQLDFQFVFAQLFLAQGFDGADEPGSFFTRHVDFPELTFPQSFPNVKVVEADQCMYGLKVTGHKRGEAMPAKKSKRFLTVAETMHAVAIGYDWFYDALSLEQQKAVQAGRSPRLVY